MCEDFRVGATEDTISKHINQMLKLKVQIQNVVLFTFNAGDVKI